MLEENFQSPFPRPNALQNRNQFPRLHVFQFPRVVCIHHQRYHPNMAAKRDISVAGTSDNSISSTCLSSLPPELQTQIFKQLDGATATCLGLTCKRFYPIHREKNGTVPAKKVWYQSMPTPGNALGYRRDKLGDLLEGWCWKGEELKW